MTDSGKIRVWVAEDKASLVGAKAIEIHDFAFGKTSDFNQDNFNLYDIDLLDSKGNKISEYPADFRAEILLPVRRGREVLAVKHFKDKEDSSKYEIIPSEGNRKRRGKIS